MDAVLRELKGLNRHVLAFEPLTQPNFIVRLKQEQATLRRVVLRIKTIRETSFVGAGYAVAELTSTMLVIGLLFFRIPPLGAELFLVGLLAYVIVLIKDLDDPFECNYEAEGAAEVSLKPLAEVEQSMSTRSSVAPGHSAARTAARRSIVAASLRRRFQ